MIRSSGNALEFPCRFLERTGIALLILASKSSGENAVCIQNCHCVICAPADRVEANPRCNPPWRNLSMTNCNVTELLIRQLQKLIRSSIDDSQSLIFFFLIYIRETGVIIIITYDLGKRATHS